MGEFIVTYFIVWDNYKNFKFLIHVKIPNIKRNKKFRYKIVSI